MRPVLRFLWLNKDVPIYRVPASSRSSGITSLCNEVLLHIVEQDVIVVFDPADTDISE